MNELDRALSQRSKLDALKRARLLSLMNAAIPDALVENYELLIDVLELPDKDDRYVLAAAIKAEAETIVTMNLNDFPADALQPWNISAQSPDDFVLDLIDTSDRVVFACVQQIADQRNNPPETVDDVLRQLERSGLIQSAAALRFG